MAIDAAIPLGTKVPDGMTTLGSMLGTANAATQLQGSRANLQERNNVRALFQDPSQFTDDQGNIDFNKATPLIMQAAPTQGAGILKTIIETQKEAIAAKSAIGSLSDQQRQSASTFVASLGDDTPDAAKKKMDAVATLNPQLAPALDFAWKHYLAPNASDPQAFKTAAIKIGQSVMAPGAQLTATTPSGPTVSTGTETHVVNTNPGAGQIGATIPGTSAVQQVPPTQQEAPTTDVLGNPAVAAKTPSGALSVKPMPGATTPPMMSYPPGESQGTRAALEQERQAALQTLAGAPVMHATNRGVLEEIDKTATGTLGPRMAQIMSAAGASLPKGWGGATAEEKASAYDLVGKYLERNAITAAQSMGPHTNAGLESQIKAQGSVAYNPTAIKKITQLNDALVTGAEHYQPGLEKAITESPNQIFAKRAYDQAWAQNFDPRVMMLFNAQSSGNTNEVQNLVRSWGGKDSATTKDVLRRAKNLDALSTTGRLP